MMDFLLLGPFEARNDGKPVDLGDVQQRYVLLVLIQHARRPVSAQRLTHIVWDGQRTPQTNLVAGYISRLRKVFRDAGAEDVRIERSTTGYVLQINDEQLDTMEFRRLRDEAAQARTEGRGEEARRLLHEALRLWRGGYLEDLDVERIGPAPELAEARIDVIGDLAELELAAGNHRWARDALSPVVRAEPQRQRLAILLMRALLRNDDRVPAMQVYHLVRDALDDYGMATAPELRSLVRLAQYDKTRNTLPAQPPRFTGRQPESTAIEKLAAAQDGPRVVWLSGLPGIGKTALAVRLAHKLRPTFPHAQVFVQLNGFTPNSAPTEPVDALGALLTGLGVPPEQLPADEAGRATLYQAQLAGTRAIVVLDNAATEEQLRTLLPEAAGCLTIVTSRQVCTAGAGENIRLAPLPATSAAELFTALVGAERIHGEIPLVHEVIEQCARIPVRIRVAATHLHRHPAWSVRHLLDLLRDAGLAQTEDAAYRVSYDYLPEGSREMFRMFGLAAGPELSLHAAAALTARPLPRVRAELDDLLAASLLEEDTPDRYRMLDPLRRYAATLPTPDELADAPVRLLDFYLTGTAAAVALVFPFDQDRQPAPVRPSPEFPALPDTTAALAWLQDERVNLVAAVRYAAEHGHPEHAWRIAVLLWRYCYTHEHLRDWREMMLAAYEVTTVDGADPVGKAAVRLRLADAYWKSGELTLALETAGHAMSLWTTLGDPRGEADTLSAIGRANTDLGEYDQAEAHFTAAIRKYREIGDARGEGAALSNLGHLLEKRGQLERAEQAQSAALPLLREIGQLHGLLHTLDNLGSIQQRLHRPQDALSSHEQARTLAIETGDRCGESHALNNIGNVHRQLGHLDEARDYHDRARRAADDVTDPALRTQLYLDRGSTELARADLPNALTAYRAALDLASGTGDRTQQAHAHAGIAWSLHARGGHEQATEHWGAAGELFDLLGLPDGAELADARRELTCPCAG